jgi:hypothetical protein
MPTIIKIHKHIFSVDIFFFSKGIPNRAIRASRKFGTGYDLKDLNHLNHPFNMGVLKKHKNKFELKVNDSIIGTTFQSNISKEITNFVYIRHSDNAPFTSLLPELPSNTLHFKQKNGIGSAKNMIILNSDGDQIFELLKQRPKKYLTDFSEYSILMYEAVYNPLSYLEICLIIVSRFFPSNDVFSYKKEGIQD